MKDWYSIRISERWGATADLLIESERMVVLTRMYVPELHRRKGIGTKLLNMVLEDADKEGVTIKLIPANDDFDVVGYTNEDLKKWYAKFGFTETPLGTYWERKPKE